MMPALIGGIFKTAGHIRFPPFRSASLQAHNLLLSKTRSPNLALQSAIGKLNGFGAQNEGTMSNLLAGYSAPVQEAQLASDRAKRSANNVAVITTQDPNSIPIQADASPATEWNSTSVRTGKSMN